MLEQLLSNDEINALSNKMENGANPKVDHKNEQSLKKRDLNLVRLEKQFAKAQVKYETTKQRYKTKKEQKIAKIKAKSSSLNELDSSKYQFKQTTIIQEIEKFYQEKNHKLDENFDLLTQNYNLAVEDVNEGYSNEVKYSQKIYVDNLQKKYDVINLKRNIQKYKNSVAKNEEISKSEILAMCLESETKYQPLKYKTQNYFTNLKEKTALWWLKTQVKWARCSQWTLMDWITVKIWTIPIYLYAAFFGVILAAILTNAVQTNMIYPIGIMFIIAILGGTIFSKIPIWKKYVGGGVLGSLFVGALLVYLNAIPKDSSTYMTIEAWFSGSFSFHHDGQTTKVPGQDFLSFYISILLVGAVLLIPKKMILKATGGFLLLIVVGTALATGLGLLAGVITGMSVDNLILKYALPILADGNGGGLMPMKKIAEANGYDSNTWYSQALAISTLASVFSIIASAILNGIGKAKPNLSGEGKLIQQNIRIVERKPVVKDRNIASGLILIVIIYICSDLIAEKILTESVLGILVPNFAWMVIICLILNLTNVIPPEVKMGTQKVNTFVSKQTTWLLMVGVGICNIDLAEFFNALNPTSLFVTLLFILGALFGPLLLAKMIKFNPIESAISAGMCMTAQGGSGSIACLGASNRMELMPWSQITCRIAGSIILIFAALAFAGWPAQVAPAASGLML